MSSSDSMFVFEFFIKDLISFVSLKEFYVVSQFADVFKITFTNPILANVKMLKGTKTSEKPKKKEKGFPANRYLSLCKTHMEESILFTSDIKLLIFKMKSYPMELSLRDKMHSKNKLGSTHIFWNNLYVEYLNKVYKNQELPGPTINATYDIFDEITSKCMAKVKLQMTLRKVNNEFMVKNNTFSESKINLTKNSCNSKIIAATEAHKIDYMNRLKETKDDLKRNKRNIIGNENEIWKDSLKEDISDLNTSYTLPSLIETHLNCNEQINVANIRSRNFPVGKINPLKYIFGDESAMRKQICHVNYFIVENTSANSGSYANPNQSAPADNSKKKSSEAVPLKSLKKSDSMPLDTVSSKPSETRTNGNVEESICKDYIVKIRKCYKMPSDSCIQRQSSLHLANEMPTCVSKCKNVRCENKSYLPRPKPEEPVLLDLTGKPCCSYETKEVTEFSGAMKAKMKFDDNPCFCTCECSFGFTKKTTICKICGGYETPGDEPNMKTLFPCPFFHNLIDKTKVKSGTTIGSDSKKKDTTVVSDKHQRGTKEIKESSGNNSADTKKSKKGVKSKDKKNIESEKDLKSSKKKKRDYKFKFNYGYTAPLIGHSECALLAHNVPRDMGWLWDEDILGLQVKPGWRPGAISKRLLRKLKKAKKEKSVDTEIIPVKKLTKCVEDKPTLLVSKKDGEYRVEMQMKPENNVSNEQYSPVIYKITSANNQDKIKKRERMERRLIRQAVARVWKDPYHPETCEKTCLKAYDRAVSYLEFHPDNPDYCYLGENTEEPKESTLSCSCKDESVSSNCSSLDLDWEIHFSPPVDSCRS